MLGLARHDKRHDECASIVARDSFIEGPFLNFHLVISYFCLIGLCKHVKQQDLVALCILKKDKCSNAFVWSLHTIILREQGPGALHFLASSLRHLLHRYFPVIETSKPQSDLGGQAQLQSRRHPAP